MTQILDIATPSPCDPGIPVETSAASEDPAVLDRIVAALEARFGSSLPPMERREIARQALDHYRHASIQSFVAVLAPRLAVEIATQHLNVWAQMPPSPGTRHHESDIGGNAETACDQSGAEPASSMIRARRSASLKA